MGTTFETPANRSVEDATAVRIQRLIGAGAMGDLPLDGVLHPSPAPYSRFDRLVYSGCDLVGQLEIRHRDADWAGQSWSCSEHQDVCFVISESKILAAREGIGPVWLVVEDRNGHLVAARLDLVDYRLGGAGRRRNPRPGEYLDPLAHVSTGAFEPL